MYRKTVRAKSAGNGNGKTFMAVARELALPTTDVSPRSSAGTVWPTSFVRRNDVRGTRGIVVTGKKPVKNPRKTAGHATEYPARARRRISSGRRRCVHGRRYCMHARIVLYGCAHTSVCVRLFFFPNRRRPFRKFSREGGKKKRNVGRSVGCFRIAPFPCSDRPDAPWSAGRACTRSLVSRFPRGSPACVGRAAGQQDRTAPLGRHPDRGINSSSNRGINSNRGTARRRCPVRRGPFAWRRVREPSACRRRVVSPKTIPPCARARRSQRSRPPIRPSPRVRDHPRAGRRFPAASSFSSAAGRFPVVFPAAFRRRPLAFVPFGLPAQ